MSIHRYIAATHKHPAKTACGIKLMPGQIMVPDNWQRSLVRSDDGIELEVTNVGQPLDCKRCLDRLRLRKGSA